MDTDIIFLSYDEPNADENWQNLKSRYPRAQRVHGIKGIWEAHCECARISRSDYFFLVDADNLILEGVDFETELNLLGSLENKTFVWRTINPVNDIVSGNGGVKLFSKSVFSAKSLEIDICKSNTKNYIRVPRTLSVTHFNSSELNTWRSAFRDTVKLSAGISGEDEESRSYRLYAWCNKGLGRPYGEWSISGARTGKEYGHLNKDNKERLYLINDYDWLEEQFNLLTRDQAVF